MAETPRGIIVGAAGASALAADMPPGVPREKPVSMVELIRAFAEDVEVWFLSTDLSRLALEIALSATVVLVVFLGLSFFVRRVGRRLTARAEREGSSPGGPRLLGVLGKLVTRTSTLFLLVAALAAGSYFISVPAPVRAVVTSLFVIGFFLQAAIWANALVSVWLASFAARQSGDRSSVASATSIIGVLGRTAVWATAILLILDNLGFNVTALVAGLGIGGIAIGLALQNVLGDLFASLSIIFDKPFEIGDFIVAGDQMGTVERIGLKTTRLRSLSGEQIVIANADLLGSRIRNYKRMAERRQVFTLRVAFGTPVAALARLPTLIREIIEAQPDIRFDRSHFTGFGDYGLHVETAYFVRSADYGLFMDRQQAIHLEIYRRLEAEGIHLALMPWVSSHEDPRERLLITQ